MASLIPESNLGFERGKDDRLRLIGRVSNAHAYIFWCAADIFACSAVDLYGSDMGGIEPLGKVFAVFLKICFPRICR